MTALVVAIVFGGLGTYLLVTSRAATPAASVEAESGTVTSPASSVADTTASGGSAIKFNSASTGGGGGTAGCTPYADIPAGFPNNCTTGYQNAPDYPGSLKSCGAIVSNTTYNFCSFGVTTVSGTNITFHGCLFKANAVDNALVVVIGDNITFDYSTFQPNATFVHDQQVAHATSYQYGIAANGGYGSKVQQMTVSNSDFWGFGNAVDTLGSTQAKPQVFSNNWIHDAANDGGSDYHTDGFGSESGSGNGSYVVINHNTIISPGNTNGLAFQQGSYSNFTITNNVFGGFGYTVALWAPAPNTTFTGNSFDNIIAPTFGPLYPQSFWTSSGSVWKNNKWLVPAGSATGNPAQNGEFWTPNGPSTTDYSG